MVVVGFWKILGVYFFLYTGDFCISGFTTIQPLCCRIFVKSKVMILDFENFYNPSFPKTISAVLTV